MNYKNWIYMKKIQTAMKKYKKKIKKKVKFKNKKKMSMMCI